VTRRRNAERAARGRLAEAEARAAQAAAELDLVARAEHAPSVEVERANVAQARQAVARAEVDLTLLTVRAPRAATVLQVNVRPGEFALAGSLSTPLMVLGQLDPLHVRVDIDEIDIGMFEPGARAYASLRGQATRRIELSFVRVDPLVVPKRSLTGAGIERVDTRVLRVVYAMEPGTAGAYPGQQVDVFIETPAPAATAATGAAPIPAP
jgi:multidrug resistance efflux pump